MEVFIHQGTAKRQIVRREDEPFLRDLQQKGAVSNRWGHLLTAESGAKGIEARIQFFIGPEVRPLVWSVVISVQPTAHVQSTGSAFMYFDDVNDEYQGERIDLIAV